MDRFEEMQTFVKVVELGGVSATADRLEIAKSAVSRRLADLEARLGVQLLHRTTRKMNLTHSGQQFYQRCLRILADLDETEQYISQEDKQLRGIIRLSAPLSFGLAHLSPLLNEFLVSHPELDFALDLNDSQINLMNEGIDLGIRIGHLEDSSLMARKLASCHSVMCASPEYLQRYGEPKHPDELAHHYGLSYSNVTDQVEWKMKDVHGKQFVTRPHIRMRANNGDLLKAAALEHLGILVSVSFTCYQEIESGLLKQVMQDYVFEEFGIYAIYPAQRHLPKRVRTLIDFLAEKFGEAPYWNTFLGGK